MIDIRPDPKHPAGGFAEITISGAEADGDQVMVSVFNSYQQKWLSPEGWQANRTSIPAREASQTDGGLRVIVGPEIVNQIEEDTPLRIEVAGGSWDTYWPDDINAGPDEAVIGGIGGTGAAPEAKEPTVMVAQPAEEADETVLPASESTGQNQTELTDEVSDETDEDEVKKSMTGIIAAVVVLILILAAGAYYFMNSSNEQPVETAVVAPEPQSESAPVADDCALDQVAALSSEGFGPVAARIRECGGSLSADNALGFVEKAANLGDAEALALFGALYDNTVTDDVIEGQIGLTFPDEPARAAEYYSRAAEAGSEDAGTRLTAVCTRLRLKSDTLSQSAYEDYCQ